MPVTTCIGLFSILWLLFLPFIEFVFHLALLACTLRLGIEIPAGRVGIPGRIEVAYIKWCRRNGHPLGAYAAMRGVLLFLDVSAVTIFLLVCTHRLG